MPKITTRTRCYLAGGVAIVKLGAAIETETKEIKAHVEDISKRGIAEPEGILCPMEKTGVAECFVDACKN